MTKLADTQLIVLSSAAKHDVGLATRPANLNAAAAAKVASSLIDKGLTREIRVSPEAPVWYGNEDGRFTLTFTKAGRDAIGVDDDETQHLAPASADSSAAKSKKGLSKPAATTDAKTPAAQSKETRRKAAESAASAPVNSARCRHLPLWQDLSI